MRRLTKARAPAKLILSGEHSVVYGKPALAMATHYYTESIAEASFSPLPLSRHIGFRLPQLQYVKKLSLATLNKLKRRVHQDYTAFLAGECGIRDVLKKPMELIQFTVANLLDLSQAMTQSMNVQTHSTIPIGCGMGSSAALVMSTLRAVAQLFNLELEEEAYLRLGIDAENLQHGYSSGLDIQLIWQGGCVYFKEGQATARVTSLLPLYGVNTGKPVSTTGECVMHARQYFLASKIAEDFEAVTNALDGAFLENNRVAVQQGIRENHRLLCQIGVVPEPVARFIAALEAVGAAAKISGAGAVSGERAGMILVVPETVESVQTVIDAFGFSIESIQGDSYGTHIV
jgi:mevalonate kinase